MIDRRTRPDVLFLLPEHLVNVVLTTRGGQQAGAVLLVGLQAVANLRDPRVDEFLRLDRPSIRLLEFADIRRFVLDKDPALWLLVLP